MYRFKGFVCVCFSVIVALVCCASVKLAYLPRFRDIQGERMYFLDKASSQCLQASRLSLWDIPRVEGECVYTTISNYVGGRYLTKEEIVKEIVQNYNAEILFCEEVNGIVSYYAYTHDWSDGIYLYGRKINLHVAVGEEKLALGTPIVFGGY